MTREEAINEIKSWDFLEGKEIEAIQTLIPELRESDDERIREELIETVNSINDGMIVLSEQQKQRYLAWLEKHKEPVRKFTVQELLDEYDKGYEHGKLEGCTAGYNKAMKDVELKEQNPNCSAYLDLASNEFEACMLRYLQSAFNRKNDFEINVDTKKYAGQLLEIAKKEQKPILKFKVGDKIHLIDGTSPNYEDDCITIREIGTINYIGEFKEGYVPIKEQDKWELVKEQKPNYCHYGGDPSEERCKYCSAACSARITEEQKPEWSEEDERILDGLIRLYSNTYSGERWPWKIGEPITYGDIVKFLKSLKPQKHWKPSEEQMKALQHAIDACELEWVYQDDELRSLFTDLEKLM